MGAHAGADTEGDVRAATFDTTSVNRETSSSESNRDKVERDTEVRRHRAERKCLQAALSEATASRRTSRPLEDKVARLREEAERLRMREAELIHARDRALARAAALEVANAELECARKDAIRRLAALAPDPTPAPATRPLREVVYADELELPAALLAGHDVFFFTGQLRKSTATTAANSLRVLGAREIGAFCVHKGSIGPKAFPPNALVILDIRFVGHSQSSAIEGRAERSGAQYLAVRSGKGSLARTVAAALEGRNEGRDGDESP